MRESKNRSGWHPADIIAALKKINSSLAALARSQGLHPRSPSAVMNRPYYRFEQLIAQALGVPAREIWPDRYDKQNQPVYRRRSA